MDAWIETLGILIASATAVWGVIGWRKQMVTERKISLAAEVLASFYQIKDIIENARRPMSWGSEGRGWRDEVANLADRPEFRQIDAYYAPAERLIKHTKFFSDFDTLKYRSQAILGEDVSEHFTAVQKARNRVKLSSFSLTRYQYEALQPGGSPIDPDFSKELRSDIWWNSAGDGIEPDKINRQVDAAVAGIESICRPLLNESPSLGPKW